MKKIEVKLSSFQAENYRLQLLYVTKTYKNGIIKTNYEVRENRKIICNTVMHDDAKAIYSRCIYDELNATIEIHEDIFDKFKNNIPSNLTLNI